MLYTGIDEAGLGPTLGPYCMVSATIKAPEGDELFQQLAPTLGASVRDNEKLLIKDSKKLFNRKTGIKHLERMALSLFSLKTGSTPETAAQWFNELAGVQTTTAIEKTPWYAGLSKINLPLQANIDNIDATVTNAKTFMAENDIELTSLKMGILGAESLNRLIDKYDNKATACQSVLAPLLIKASQVAGRITVDRQGGRTYYHQWLSEVFNGEWVAIVAEGASVSAYEIAARKQRISFEIKADDRYLETALASIIAKYSREILMLLFNRHWQSLCPEIKDTAGYPQDAKRFINELENAGLLPENHDRLIRKR